MLQDAGGGGGAGVLETGQMVVERMIVSVVKWPLPGQFVTEGAQEVLV